MTQLKAAEDSETQDKKRIDYIHWKVQNTCLYKQKESQKTNSTAAQQCYYKAEAMTYWFHGSGRQLRDLWHITGNIIIK